MFRRGYVVLSRGGGSLITIYSLANGLALHQLSLFSLDKIGVLWALDGTLYFQSSKPQKNYCYFFYQSDTIPSSVSFFAECRPLESTPDNVVFATVPNYSIKYVSILNFCHVSTSRNALHEIGLLHIIAYSVKVFLKLCVSSFRPICAHDNSLLRLFSKIQSGGNIKIIISLFNCF